MLMPSIFGENLFDDWFDDFPFYNDKDMRNVDKKLYGKKAGRIMKTDIKENDTLYPECTGGYWPELHEVCHRPAPAGQLQGDGRAL